MADLSKMKLGRKPVVRDSRTLMMARYVTPGLLPAAPDTINWGLPVQEWGMMKNDRYGNCTCASFAHLVMLWTGNQGHLTQPSDKDVLDMYSKITGFDPGPPPENDNGAVELYVLKYIRKNGFAGHPLTAFVECNPQSRSQLKLATYLFGGIYAGVALPKRAQTQDVWDVPPGQLNDDDIAGSWGGHAVPIIAYDAEGLTCVTWGGLKKMTWKWWMNYGQEAYALLSPEWFSTAELAPNSFDMKTLADDLAVLEGVA